MSSRRVRSGGIRKTRGSSRLGSTGVRNLTSRVGSGRVGSGRVGSGRVGSGRVGWGQVVFKHHGSGRVTLIPSDLLKVGCPTREKP